MSNAGTGDCCSELVHFIVWKSKCLTWSVWGNAGAGDYCSELVHSAVWNSKGLIRGLIKAEYRPK